MSIVIPSSIISDFNLAMDAFLIEPMSIIATLVMPPRKVVCYCSVDNVGNKPRNFDWSGRPNPFSQLGSCSNCNGTGFRQEEVTEDISIRPYWNPKEWLAIKTLDGTSRQHENNIIVADNTRVQIKTYLYNLPKLLNCVYLQFTNQPALREYTSYRFTLEGEPVPIGLGHERFIIAFFKRAI